MTGYIFDFKGHGQFDPNGRVEVDNVTEHNRKSEQAELAHWQTKPDRFLAYIIKRDDPSGNALGRYVPTTWLGTELGRIVECRRHTNNLGARIRYVRIVGNNGATYSGSYGCDWSQAVRLRRIKDKR